MLLELTVNTLPEINTLPDTFKLPPTYRFLAIPAPPETKNGATVVLVASVVLLIVALDVVTFVKPANVVDVPPNPIAVLPTVTLLAESLLTLIPAEELMSASRIVPLAIIVDVTVPVSVVYTPFVTVVALVALVAFPLNVP